MTSTNLPKFDAEKMLAMSIAETKPSKPAHEPGAQSQWQGQPPYTPDQVLANLAQIRDMLAGDYGDKAQWIRFVCNDIRARGIKL